jgi:hypothetical protein
MRRESPISNRPRNRVNSRLLFENDFDPAADITAAENGSWRWATDKSALHEAVRLYFRNRREDGDDAASPTVSKERTVVDIDDLMAREALSSIQESCDQTGSEVRERLNSLESENAQLRRVIVTMSIESAFLKRGLIGQSAPLASTVQQEVGMVQKTPPAFCAAGVHDIIWR